MAKKKRINKSLLGLRLAMTESLRGKVMNLYEYFKKQNLERLKRIRINYLIELKMLNEVIKQKEEKRSKSKQIKFRGI